MKQLKYSPVVRLTRKDGGQFSAYQARHQAFGGLMNPVIGFDYYWLTADVFGPHRHEGMSAISYILEDSAPYHNQDSMGTDLTITPGSLLWTWAGSGVVHHEFPILKDKQVRGLQLFLDIAPAKRGLAPKSIFIPKETMPVITSDGVSVKVAMGATGEVVNPSETPEPVTLLDIRLDAGKRFVHSLPAGWNGTIFILSGAVGVDTIQDAAPLVAHETVAFGGADSIQNIVLAAAANSQVLLISGPPVLLS